MKKFLHFFFIIFILAGCSNNDDETFMVEGIWQMEFPDINDLIQNVEVNGEESHVVSDQSGSRKELD